MSVSQNNGDRVSRFSTELSFTTDAETVQSVIDRRIGLGGRCASHPDRADSFARVRDDGVYKNSFGVTGNTVPFSLAQTPAITVPVDDVDDISAAHNLWHRSSKTTS